jgi:hypothetical protein
MLSLDSIFLVARLLDVEDLAAQRQDRLELAVAALLGAAAGGVTLDDVDLAQRRVLLLAVGQLAGQAHAVEHASCARHLARLARGLAGARGLDDLAADDLGVDRVLEQPVGSSLLATISSTGPRTSELTSLSLVWLENLGSGTLTLSTQARPSRMSSPADLDLGLLGQLVVVDVLVDDARHRARRPVRWVPPSRCGMLLVKHSTLSL